MVTDSLIVKSIAELNAQQAVEQVKTRLAQGGDPQAILLECRQGMEEIGRKFEACEYFIAELVFAANFFKKIMEVLEPELRKTIEGEKLGNILIATVKNDIHDIGKNLVASMLNAAGFEISDLGVNVPPETLCDWMKSHPTDIVALSCLLTSTVDSMEETIDEIVRAGLRDQVKIIVGGIPLSSQLAVSIGADAYGRDAYDAVIQVKELIKKR